MPITSKSKFNKNIKFLQIYVEYTANYHICYMKLLYGSNLYGIQNKKKDPEE